MKAPWEKDKRWSDRFIPQIKHILGPFVIREPNIEEDQLRNTDLISLVAHPTRISCRIQRHKFIRFSDGFTIRYSRPSGVDTELQKIMQGHGDWFFYGFCNDIEDRVILWTLVDLEVFREKYSIEGDRIGEIKRNYDGSSRFIIFKYQDFPQHFVIARHRLEEL